MFLPPMSLLHSRFSMLGARNELITVVAGDVVIAGAAPDRAVHDVRDEHGGVHGGAGQARRRPARRHLHRSDHSPKPFLSFRPRRRLEF